MFLKFREVSQTTVFDQPWKFRPDWFSHVGVYKCHTSGFASPLQYQYQNNIWLYSLLAFILYTKVLGDNFIPDFALYVRACNWFYRLTQGLCPFWPTLYFWSKRKIVIMNPFYMVNKWWFCLVDISPRSPSYWLGDMGRTNSALHNARYTSCPFSAQWCLVPTAEEREGGI